MPAHFFERRAPSQTPLRDDGRRRGVHLQCGPHDMPATCCTAAAAKLTPAQAWKSKPGPLKQFNTFAQQLPPHCQREKA